ncbi:MAG TPA: efflux transporter outer membrane subunit [Bryobacteraceae bacterium]|nr:efflux transporter outer membrane subunit [Bryobacteraceae bacterium]
MTSRFVVALMAVVLAGCAVGPNYKRPQVAVPDTFRGAAETTAAQASLADTKWDALFGDETLNGLIRTALERNFDARIAAERVQQARAQLGITRADQFPFVDAQAQFTAARQSSLGALRFVPVGTNLSATFTQLGAALSWEVDLWGRLRRLTEAARARYLASEEGRRAVTVALIADVTNAYFQLLEYELELEISRKTRDAAAESLRIVQLRRDQGAASGLDVRQAEQLIRTTATQVEAVERGIAQTENLLSYLLGSAPSAQPRGQRLDQVPLPAEFPAGLPSSLLERRPDIRAAEQNLIAANAEIGAARALFFPQISLNAFAGGQSRALTQIASSPARVYSLAPAAILPIFRAGQIRSQVRLTEAQQRELLVTYEQSIYNGLREVSDALVGYSRTRSQRAEQEQLVRALEETVRLSTLRYRGGLDSYLQVLDAQRNLFTGELGLAQLRLAERLSVVQLYRSLGGGWQL